MHNTFIFAVILAPSIKCLPGQSAYTENDLKVIINEVLSKSQTIKIIHESYYQRGLALRDKYEQYLNDIEKRFEERPYYLNYIIEEIILKRKIVEKIVKSISIILNEYDYYEKIFNDTQIKVNKLQLKIQETMQICQLNCKHNETKKGLLIYVVIYVIMNIQ